MPMVFVTTQILDTNVHAWRDGLEPTVMSVSPMVIVACDTHVMCM